VVEMVDSADAGQGRVRGDAVLGVDDVIIAATRLERRGKHGDRAHDPLPDRFLIACLEGHRADADTSSHRPKEGSVATPAERPHVYLDAQVGEGFGECQGMHNAAPRLGRVREQGDPHDGLSLSSAVVVRCVV